MVLEMVALLYALGRGDLKHFGAVIKSLFWLLVHPGVIYRKRQKVKKVRTISDRELLKQLYRGSIVFSHYIRGIKKYSEL